MADLVDPHYKRVFALELGFAGLEIELEVIGDEPLRVRPLPLPEDELGRKDLARTSG